MSIGVTPGPIGSDTYYFFSSGGTGVDTVILEAPRCRQRELHSLFRGVRQHMRLRDMGPLPRGSMQYGNNGYM